MRKSFIAAAPVFSGLLASSLFLTTALPAQAITWGQIRNIFRREGERGGTTSGFCILSPNIMSNVFLDKTPLFVWQGEVKKLEVFYPHEYAEAIWTVDELEGKHKVEYQSTIDLIRGQEYHLIINDSERYSFEILREEDEHYDTLISIRNELKSMRLNDLAHNSGQHLISKLNHNDQWFTTFIRDIFDRLEVDDSTEVSLVDNFCNPF